MHDETKSLRLLLLLLAVLSLVLLLVVLLVCCRGTARCGPRATEAAAVDLQAVYRTAVGRGNGSERGFLSRSITVPAWMRCGNGRIGVDVITVPAWMRCGNGWSRSGRHSYHGSGVDALRQRMGSDWALSHCSGIYALPQRMELERTLSRLRHGCLFLHLDSMPLNPKPSSAVGRFPVCRPCPRPRISGHHRTLRFPSRGL